MLVQTEKYNIVVKIGEKPVYRKHRYQWQWQFEKIRCFLLKSQPWLQKPAPHRLSKLTLRNKH
jgi:hypothetical protein